MRTVDVLPIRLSSGHCCVCDGATCNHIGVLLCNTHKQKEATKKQMLAYSVADVNSTLAVYPPIKPLTVSRDILEARTARAEDVIYQELLRKSKEGK